MSNPRRLGIRENFVYWLFAKDDECLYVGVTRKPETRWAQHRATKPDMYPQIAYHRMAGPFDLETARKLEREQQEDLNPIYDANLGRPAEAARRNEEVKWRRLLESVKK